MTAAGGWNIFEAARPSSTPEVYRSAEGTGFPSASRALAKLPRNTNDANGYYALLDVEPWASDAEIKRALRKKMVSVHPDNPDNADISDEQRATNLKTFMRLQEIAEVLLNAVMRANYNLIPPGRKLIDSEVRDDLAAKGIVDDPTIQPFADGADLSPRNNQSGDAERARTTRRERYFDYLATNHQELDLITANEWYHVLLDVAPMFNFTASIKVLLHDGKHSAVKKIGNIIMIPRSFEPSRALAFAIFERHFGWPKVDQPRFPLVEPQSEDTWSARHATFYPSTTTSGKRATFTGTGLNGGGGLLNVDTLFAKPAPVSVVGDSVDPDRD